MATPRPQTTAQGEEAAVLAALIDRDAITRTIVNWGLYRDGGNWDGLRALYAPGAIMVTTWCRGPAEEFVARSMAAAAKGARVAHVVSVPSIRLKGDRAVADTRVNIQARVKVDGHECDVSCLGRFHDRLVRAGDEWKILLRTPVYDKDRLDPVDPQSTLALDPVKLASFAEGYRHLAYVQSLAGDTLTPGLPTPGSVEERVLCAESDAWLNGGNAS